MINIPGISLTHTIQLALTRTGDDNRTVFYNFSHCTKTFHARHTAPILLEIARLFGCWRSQKHQGEICINGATEETTLVDLTLPNPKP